MGSLDAQLRELAPRALAILVRRHGDFDRCEDAVQEALLAAAQQWPSGAPGNSLGWLVTVASRRWVELHRNETARRAREERAARLEPPPSPDGAVAVADDALLVLLLCCHPALSRPSQVALTLRAVGGLTTAEIARALLVPEATVGQRISRAKARIRGFPSPSAEAVAAVREVLYAIFGEGSTATSGPALHRVELSAEAIRLTRQLHRALPGDGEVAGLLALMLLTDARRPARTDAGGGLVPLAEQDRSRWDAAAIAEGVALLEAALPSGPVGPFQIQAAIAAVHAEAARVEDTDWAQILGLYDLLPPGPMVTINRAVALAEVRGPAAGLAALECVDHYRADAVRGHLHDRLGDRPAARAAYAAAAARTLSVPERRYLERKLGSGSDP